MESSYNWHYFSGTMRQSLRDGETAWASVLAVVESADDLVGRILARETSYASDRPQDYVASILVTRCFRLAISAIYLALSGYPDASPNLRRTIWETTVRLFYMAEHPVQGALGYLLQGVFEELAIARSAQGDKASLGEPAGVHEDHIAALETQYGKLEGLATTKGYDPVQLRRKYGKLNFREICTRYGVETAYTVNYAFASGYVHEKNHATRDFMSDGPDVRQFELGPITEPRVEAVADTIHDLFSAIHGAANVVGDMSIQLETDRILGSLQSISGWPSSPSSA